MQPDQKPVAIIDEYLAEVVEIPTIQNGYSFYVKTSEGTLVNLKMIQFGCPIGTKGVLYKRTENFVSTFWFRPDYLGRW